MQNKPNFVDAQMNITSFEKRDYRNNPALPGYKNKPNSKPIQTQTNPISQEPEMNITSIVTKDYKEKCG
jgi:hypothetical protein